MDKGQIVEMGSPQELIKKHQAKNIEEVFLKTTGHNIGAEEVNKNATDPFARMRS